MFTFFQKKPKISNLPRDKALEFQNNMPEGMKTALHGGKKVKTQLFRRRGTEKTKRKLSDFEEIVGSK